MDAERQHRLDLAAAAAERFAELADVAELMGDADGAALLRRRADTARESAMSMLDD